MLGGIQASPYNIPDFAQDAKDLDTYDDAKVAVEAAAAAMERALALAPDDCMTREILKNAREYARTPAPPDWNIVKLESK